MPDSDAYSEIIDAPQQRIVEVLLDFERYAEWQGPVYACHVRDRDGDGRGRLVEMQVDARIRKVRYTTRYWYDLDNGRMGFDLVDGDLGVCEGRYRFEPLEDGRTRVSIAITAEPRFFMPAPMKRLVRAQSVRNSMRDLRRRVEG